MGVWAGRLAGLGLLVAAMVGCQALKDTLPTKPDDPSPRPSQSPIAIPVVMPSPTPTPILGAPGSPNPSPSPSATPTPSPTAAPPPTGGSCSLPASTNPDPPCTMQSPLFFSAVDNALTLAVQQQPSNFGDTTTSCPNCFFVKDVNAYVTGVIKNLNAAGFCARWDGEELGVKNTNSFDEQYDILLSSGHMRRGTGSYRSTCNPSWF
jgi:hypothetical protein